MNAVRQNSVAPAIETPAVAAAPTVSGLAGLVPKSPVSSTASAAPSAIPADASSTPSANTPDDDYWASQPPAVQQLRTIQDPNQRAQVATQLAGQGYKIDLPIMVWGWDPVTTMQLRQSFGYTWVPALGQPGIPVAPGLNFPGLASYDPANPPSGSISVSLPT